MSENRIIDTYKKVTPAAVDVLDASRAVLTRHPVASAATLAGIGGLVLGAAVTALRHRRDAVAVVIAVHGANDTDAIAPTPPPSGGYMTAPFGSGGFDFPDDTSPFEEDDEEGDLR